MPSHSHFTTWIALNKIFTLLHTYCLWIKFWLVFGRLQNLSWGILCNVIVPRFRIVHSINIWEYLVIMLLMYILYIRNTNPKFKNWFKYAGTQYRLHKRALIPTIWSDFHLSNWFNHPGPGHCGAGCFGLQSSLHHNGRARGD